MVRDYSFARSPRWVAIHLLVVVLVAGAVAAGFWQLRRLDERRDTNELVEQRLALPAVPVEQLLVYDDLRFRHASAAGTYAPDVDATVRAPGGYVLSLLDGDAGGPVVVLRGLGAEAVAPPAGPVKVDGFLLPYDRVDRATRTAAERIDPRGAVLLQASTADSPGLTAVDPPELGEGNHLSYSVQWFLFATVGVVGYPFLLRRRAADRPE